MATALQPTPARVHVLDAYPDLARGLPPEQARIARHHLSAPTTVLRPGPAPASSGTIERQPGHLGVLVVEGLLSREVVLGGTVTTELVGRGDVLRPVDHDVAGAPVQFDIAWRVLQTTRILYLDRDFALAAGRWPEVIEEIVSSAVRRSQSLALHLAVSHLRRVDTRLLVLMWHMADRWGKVGRDGVTVPLKLTHQMLGHLVGAQRPSVTTALKQLTDEGRLSRGADGTWMLHGDPPETLARLSEGPAPDA
jgi:CRP/FNR family cyclic AMP-dependent transcriptional regulator